VCCGVHPRRSFAFALEAARAWSIPKAPYGLVGEYKCGGTEVVEDQAARVSSIARDIERCRAIPRGW
jgi:hypothetical protein